MVDTSAHTDGVIAFVPDNWNDNSDFGKIGVFVRDNNHLYFYPWLTALRSKSDHVLGAKVKRENDLTWRLEDMDGAVSWFSPFVSTEEQPVKLRRVAKTKARAANVGGTEDALDNLEYDTPITPDQSAAVSPSPDSLAVSVTPPSTRVTSTTGDKDSSAGVDVETPTPTTPPRKASSPSSPQG